MDRRKKCGTCRYFQDADIVGSGWCLHPQRGEIHDLVLVRKGELACRNSWDQDLWEPQGDQPRQQGVPPSTRDEPAPDPGVDRPVPPAVQLPGLGIEGTTDRVTEIAVPFERARPPMPMTRRWSTSSSAQPEFDLPGMGTTAIADEERSSNGLGDREFSSYRHIDDEAPAEPNDAEPQPDQRSAADPYEARSKMNVPSPPTPSAVREREARFTQDTQRPGLRARHRNGNAHQEHTAQAALGAAGGQGTEPLPIDELNKAMEYQPAEHREPLVRPGISMPVSEPQAPRSYQGWREDQPGAGAEQRAEVAPHVHVDGVDLGSGRNSEFRRNPRPAQDSSPDPIDRVTWISGIPRCCATCKDFRRGSDGKTGVCTNSYAFQEQPVVQSDQLACQSSGFVWWLPHDEVWLERADTSHHTRPTPYLDAALAIRQAGENGRESRDPVG